MDYTNQRHDTIDGYLKRFTESRYVRVFSDGTVSVSGYIDGKQITLSGDYYLVNNCIQSMLETFEK